MLNKNVLSNIVFFQAGMSVIKNCTSIDNWDYPKLFIVRNQHWQYKWIIVVMKVKVPTDTINVFILHIFVSLIQNKTTVVIFAQAPIMDAIILS